MRVARRVWNSKSLGFGTCVEIIEWKDGGGRRCEFIYYLKNIVEEKWCRVRSVFAHPKHEQIDSS